MGFIERLEEVVGSGNISASPVDCLAYSRDMSIHAGTPQVIVFAANTEQVSKIVAVANSEGIPIVARGTGSSVTGAVLPIKGGIVLDFTKMNAVKEIKKADGYAIVEPGVICNALNAKLAPTHFFPPDPGSAAIATIGGMIATNASGVRAAKYGTTKDYVKGLTVVLADGRVIHTGDIAFLQFRGDPWNNYRSHRENIANAGIRSLREGLVSRRGHRGCGRGKNIHLRSGAGNLRNTRQRLPGRGTGCIENGYPQRGELPALHGD